MVIDVRKSTNGTGPARSIYQHGHFCVRAFHLVISYPIYSLVLFFITYLQIMDIILYFKIRSRGPFDLITSINHTNSDIFKQKMSQTSKDFYIFNSLPIKKIMVGQNTHFVRSPLAEYIESRFHFTYNFPSISANTISFFHCFLSFISIKFFSSESLFRRQIGVCIFQFRSFLDCLDGVVFRAHKKNLRYKSYYGDLGYYVDAISDILGGTCLIIGCLFYFYKQRPFRSTAQQVNQSLSIRANNCSSPSSDNGSDENDFLLLNVEDEKKVLLTNDVNNNLLETKERIFISLSLFALRYSLAAMFWDRDVRAYEDLLDSHTNKLQQQAVQLSILHSPLTILIFYLWRYLSAISIQDYLLFAIFFDRTWEFIQKTSTIGWVSLFITIFLTELHVNQIRSLFSIFQDK